MTSSEQSGAGTDRAAFVMDASALLTYLRGDEGGAIVQRVLQQCRDCETRMAIPASHLLQAYAVAVRETPALLDDLVSLVDQLPLEVCPVTKETGEAAAELVVSHPKMNLELAAAMVFCGRNGTTLVTADPSMADQPGCLYVGPRAGNPGG